MVISPETLLIAIIAVPFIGGCLAILFPANARNAEAYLAGIVAVLALASVIATYPGVTNGGILQYNAAWIPELGLRFSLRMDFRRLDTVACTVALEPIRITLWRDML